MGGVRKGKKVGYVGTKKLAVVNMKKEEHQFCIDGYLVDEVLKQIPPTVKILGGIVRIGIQESTHKIVIPNVLRKLGVTSGWERSASRSWNITFDQISVSALRQNVTEACTKLNANRGKAVLRSILLSNGKGNVRFNETTKEIKPDESDLRKKLRVMGAVSGSGQVQSVIADINAKKYRCVIKEEPVKFVMCYKD